DLAAGDGVDHALHRPVAAPHEDEVRSRRDTAACLLPRPPALVHLAPHGHRADLALEPAAERTEPVPERFAGVGDDCDRGHDAASSRAPSRRGAMRWATATPVTSLRSAVTPSLGPCGPTPVRPRRACRAARPGCTASTPAASAPMPRQIPAMTSVGWCSASYTLENPTHATMHAAAAHARTRTHTTRVRVETRNATPPYRTSVAATWPDGKL